MTVPLVAISICTFERVAGLECLLEALDRQRLGALADDAVCLIVVDNSPGGSARAACDRRRGSQRFRLLYLHEPRRGLAVARNAGLKRALAEAAALVAFVDDDEMPEPDWLAALVEQLTATGACAAIGLVRPLFATCPPAWAIRGGFFAKMLPERNGSLADGYTSNALVDLAVVGRSGLWFDERYNFSGGEDTFFFQALMADGGRIVAAPGAIVWEAIPAERTRAGWLLRRWFRTGGVEARLGSHHAESVAGRLRNAGRGVARVLGGCLRLLRVAGDAGRRGDRIIQALYTICRGAGLIASAVGLEYAEYVAPTYRTKQTGAGASPP